MAVEYLSDGEGRVGPAEPFLPGALPLALLAETAAGLLAGSDPYERITEFFQRFSDQLGLEIFVQYNVSEDGTHLELNSWAGFPQKYYRLLKRLEFGQAVCGTVAQTRQPMVVSHVQASTDRKTHLIRTIGIDTYACHPLIAGGRLLGTLSFGSRRLSEFDEQTIYLLRTFCQMVASALERKQTEKALRESERVLQESNERFRASIEALNEGFEVFSAVRRDGEMIDLRYEYVNGEACKFHRLTREQLASHTLTDVFPGMRDTDLYDLYRQVIETGRPMRVQRALTTTERDQSRVQGIFDLRASKFGDGLIVTSNDITERLRLETEHHKAVQEQEIHLRLTEQRERERQSIARDLHDGPIQTLSALGFALQFLNESYDDPILKVELSQAAINVREAIQELRLVMNELRPPSLLHFGLAKSIQMHIENLGERFPEINWNLELDQDGKSLPEPVCLALYRIYQEAINNVVRHAQASDAWVRFHFQPDEATLEIADNGRGFENNRDIMELTRCHHFGLAGIAERAQAVGGELEIQASPGEGTVIRVRVPLGK